MSLTHTYPVDPELPSLTALQAFEAAVRHQSFSRAAEELHVTQGAVSRQIAGLEAKLGVTLFHREGPRVRPTRAAAEHGAKLRALLDRLSAWTHSVQHADTGGGVLQLAVIPTFGTRWLIPRLERFSARHPGVALALNSRIQAFDFELEELDAAIYHGEGSFPGANLEHLLDEEVLVVASPKWKERFHPASPADLKRLTLLRLESSRRAWDEWFRAVGAGPETTTLGPRFEHHLMILQAARAGLGCALIPTILVQEELESGELVPLFPELEPVVTSRPYWLVYPDRSRDLPALRAFRDWLVAEVQNRALPGS
ncbi:MAG: LysR substrate-binding domain-containing protein [Planctomycetota bacterium]